jgi:hypothetical protein
VQNKTGLVSLLTVLWFNAHQWAKTSSLIGQAIAEIDCNGHLSDQVVNTLVGSLFVLLEDCEKYGLKYSAIHIRRFKEQTHERQIAFSEVRATLVEIRQRVADELESSAVFFALSNEGQVYFQSSRFAEIVAERFPEVVFDCAEAGKCFSLERPTACVFHLMRVIEYGLLAVSRQLGMTSDRPNWQPVINKIEFELKQPYDQRKFKDMHDFLANVAANFNAVKVAWRNRVMHVDTKHTMEEAREIYDATRGLMRYIAEELPGPAPGSHVA